MPTWAIVLVWVVLAVLVAGAVVERRRGRRGLPPEDAYSSSRAEFEGRAQMRGHEGQGGLGG